MSDSTNEEISAEELKRFHSSIIIYFDERGIPVVKLGDVHPFMAVSLFKLLINHLESVNPYPEIWQGEAKLFTYDVDDPFMFDDDDDEDDEDD